MLVRCLLAMACAALANTVTFDFDVIPLGLMPSEGSDSRFTHESSGEVVSIEEKTDFLKDGVVKTSKVEETKKLSIRNGTVTSHKKVIEIYRYPNGTIRRVNYGDDEFSGDAMIDCVEDGDCNSTAFCDGLHFACIPKLAAGAQCQRNPQCLSGFKCRERTCVKALGVDGEPCSDDSDCEASHCCITRFGENMCSARPSLRESCSEETLLFSPRLFGLKQGLITSDLPAVCPCQAGLTCETKRFFFFVNQKVCDAPKGNDTKVFRKVPRSIGEKEDLKRTVVDDMMGLVAGLLESFVSSRESEKLSEQNEIEE